MRTGFVGFTLLMDIIRVQVAVPKTFVLQGTVCPVSDCGLEPSLLSFSHLTLRRLLHYQKQVVDLVDSIQAIATKDKKVVFALIRLKRTVGIAPNPQRLTNDISWID